MSLFRKCLLLFLCFCLSLTAMHTAVAAPAEPARPGIPDVAQLQRSLVPDSQNMVPSLVLQDRVTLIPYLEYYIDSSYAMDVTEAASEQLRDKYELFAPERMPLCGAPGIIWLRFVLQPQQDAQQRALLLDLGTSIPGTPVLYTPSFASGVLEWQELQPKNRYLELPAQGSQPVVCYLRIDGIPGFWFSPMVRTVPDAFAASERSMLYQQAPLVALAVLFLFCLLKGLTEPGQWRLWTLLFLAACGVQAWSGLAPVTGGYSAMTLASLTTAGLALMLWPHVARHFMQSRDISRALDVQLILLCLPGAAATLLPLVPNLHWVARLTEVWPLGMAIFIPSALWACIVGAQSSVRFLMATTIPPLATAAGILGLRSGFDPELLAALPHLGVALGSLVLLAAEQKKSEPAGMPAAATAPTSFALDMSPAPVQETILLDEQIGSDTSGEKNSEKAPEHTSESTAEQSLYSSILTPLRAMQNVLKDHKGKDALPESCHSSSNDLLQAAQALADELIRLEEEDVQARENARKMTVIAVSKEPGFVAVLSHVLRRRDCYIRTAASMEEAIALTKELAAKIYVFEGPFASPDVGKDVAAIAALCSEAGISPMLLAYTVDDSTWGALGNAGFTHALPLPIDDQALLNTLEEYEQELARGSSGHDTAGAAGAAGAADDAAELTEPVQEEEDTVPDLFGMGSSGMGSSGHGRHMSLKAELVQCASLARSAYMRNDMKEVMRQAGIIAERAQDVQPVARMAGLVLQAAQSGEKTAVRDLLLQLANSIETRLKG